MKTINIHEAKTQLSRLIEEAVQTDEPFIIAKAGKPMVLVSAHHGDAPVPRFGFMEGEGQIPDDLDQFAAQEILDLFEGGGTL